MFRVKVEFPASVTSTPLKLKVRETKPAGTSSKVTLVPVCSNGSQVELDTLPSMVPETEFPSLSWGYIVKS